MIRIAIGLAIVLALPACTALTESQCRSSDWHALGVRDGEQGAGPERLKEYAQNCAGYGLRPGQAEYDAGRQAGLATYCTPRNAYQLGSVGDAYLAVCPPELEPQFVAELARGRLLRPPVPQLYPYFTAIDQDERALAAALTDEERARLRARLSESESWVRRLLNHDSGNSKRR